MHEPGEGEDAPHEEEEHDERREEWYPTAALSVDPGGHHERVEKGGREDARGVRDHGIPRKPLDEARRVGRAAELDHDEREGEDDAREGQHP